MLFLDVSCKECCVKIAEETFENKFFQETVEQNTPAHHLTQKLEGLEDLLILCRNQSSSYPSSSSGQATR